MVIIGVPKEVKDNEYRIAIIPEQVAKIDKKRAKIWIEKGAGEGAGFSDEEYANAGAKIIENPAMIWKNADLILKVKEPIPEEYDLISPGQTIFTFFHLPANRGLYDVLKEKKITAVAYETIQIADGSLPILKAMSEIAGKVSVDVARFLLQKENGGMGILMENASVAILGLGNAGKAALLRLPDCPTAVLDKKITAPARFANGIGVFLPASFENIEKTVAQFDVVICSVAAAGEKTPKLITREMVKKMKRGSVLIDISIDQGGCSETSKPTSHSKPTYIEEGVVHYCVTNMPGVVPRTATSALSKEVFPYLEQILIGNWGNPALKKGINLLSGKVVHPKIAECFGEKISDY